MMHTVNLPRALQLNLKNLRNQKRNRLSKIQKSKAVKKLMLEKKKPTMRMMRMNTNVKKNTFRHTCERPRPQEIQMLEREFSRP